MPLHVLSEQGGGEGRTVAHGVASRSCCRQGGRDAEMQAVAAASS